MSVYIVGAKRTAIGAFGGKLAQISATELGAIASVAAIKSVGKPITVDSCIYGNVLQTSSGKVKV
jgi:acetyl-CoA acyltransferase 2